MDTALKVRQIGYYNTLPSCHRMWVERYPDTKEKRNPKASAFFKKVESCMSL
ncbi:MAG: hypothetical protein SOU82_05840 [Alloprevotella sp.]|nr:hypothetical protein [Alloprevotella sp.]